MRLPLLILIPAVLLCILADWYIYRILRDRCTRRLWPQLQLWSAVACLVFVIVIGCMPVRSGDDTLLRAVMWMLYTYISIYLSKFIFVAIDLIASIPRLWRGHRWRILSWAGALAAFVVFGTMWYGALVGRFNIRTKRIDVYSEQIPAAFDGFTIAQISDLHTGTYGTDTSFICKLVGEINSLHPDMVVFTGDIVNRRSEELAPFIHALGRIYAPYGVYSILGNHDYGDYSEWPSQSAKDANLSLLKDMQARMGWHMLNNSHCPIALDSDTIMLIGVENVGDPPFHTYGSLAKAYPDISDPRPKILLSHNPAHWDTEIQDNKAANILLTMSGHTHAMQIMLGDISPAALRYRHWGGLYTDADGKKLYVNIGTGEVGFPARIGATPEITLFTLHHAGGQR